MERYAIEFLTIREGHSERWLTRDGGVPLLRLTTGGQRSTISDGEANALAEQICRLLNADEVVQTPGHYTAGGQVAPWPRDPNAAGPQAPNAGPWPVDPGARNG